MNEETKMSIHRSKRRAGCTVKTIVTPGEQDDLHVHRHHHRHHHYNPPPKNFKKHTSYSVSKTVTSPPVEHSYNTRYSSSSDSDHEVDHHHEPSYSRAQDYPPILDTGIYSHGHEVDYNRPKAEELPTIPHLPDIPHIGHEGTYPKPGHGNAHDTAYGGNDQKPGEKTNTQCDGKVKVNGYPIRPNDDWRARFKDLPFLVDENGRIISSAGTSLTGFRFTLGETVFVLLVQYSLSIFLSS